MWAFTTVSPSVSAIMTASKCAGRLCFRHISSMASTPEGDVRNGVAEAYWPPSRSRFVPLSLPGSSARRCGRTCRVGDRSRARKSAGSPGIGCRFISRMPPASRWKLHSESRLLIHRLVCGTEEDQVLIGEGVQCQLALRCYPHRVPSNGEILRQRYGSQGMRQHAVALR